ncbi:class I SAM-dependent methyltransferase [Novosphingobium sp. Fuku2-ISO-50]|uniref:class I SAM-dependent methyltransferase n=1 Tax=Novosphingobium sp. Fuku2-ISO-50 TaxID=1739114 RepID=UPI00076D0808|nr:methyltransferase domain-containing protein [Novosphingobium sp. Fuku2-ISO-50]KUR76728.1 methyltransferase type 11 [Novosphingobium sp. Fuku2-ISO-50]
MPDTSPHSPEAITMEDWAGEMGERWLANLKGFESTIAPVGEALLTHAGYRPGERVLDIGFGGGATSLAIARAVAPGGEVLGIDISPDLVAATTRRAATEGVTNARFVCADAAHVIVPDAPYDRLCSRFGSMFFADPFGAFANLRKALKPGGRIDLAVWAPPRDNPWMSAAVALARRHIDLPASIPGAPGPFAFDDPAYLNAILTKAGFHAVNCVPITGLLPVGGPGSTPETALTFARNALSTGRVLLEYPDSVQQAVASELRELYAHHDRPGEGVMMGYAAWLVSARA